MFYQKPEPLLTRDKVFEIDERLDASGNIINQLNEITTSALIDQLVIDQAPESIAICLLHAYANPVHEQLVGKIIANKYPEIRVSLSSDIAPEHREYERTSTTVIDAYIGPAVDKYLVNFNHRTSRLGISKTPLIMQSNGGVVPLYTARQKVANLVVSGPAAAVTAAAEFAKRENLQNVISIDIGGTSCDVCLITKGMPQNTVKGISEFSVDGLPLNIAMTDIVTIGAGGGSIAHLDPGGMLQVGPQSAGANPGPACYNKGGSQFTLTDAMLLLGLLEAETPLPGGITLRPELSELATDLLCQTFQLEPQELADRVYRIAIANMAQAVRRVSVQRGFDPRNYVLLPCGGAGPLIAAALATEVGVKKILLPTHPGIFSALGLAMADIRIDYVQSESTIPLSSLSNIDLSDRIQKLTLQAKNEFSGLGYDISKLDLDFSVDARYKGQGYELRVPFEAFEIQEGAKTLIARFHSLHKRKFGHSFIQSAIETISFRVVGRLAREMALAQRTLQGVPNPQLERDVHLFGNNTLYQTYRREDLPVGFVTSGPAIILESTTSMPIPINWRFEVLASGAIILERSDQ